ncbi:MAG: hypothetical protein WBP97_17185 [Candidatus Sulfotelmatobacter sp.]
MTAVDFAVTAFVVPTIAGGVGRMQRSFAWWFSGRSGARGAQDDKSAGRV